MRLDVRDPCGDASNGDERTEVASLDVSNGERVVGCGGERFDVKVAVMR